MNYNDMNYEQLKKELLENVSQLYKIKFKFWSLYYKIKFDIECYVCKMLKQDK